MSNCSFEVSAALGWAQRRNRFASGPFQAQLPGRDTWPGTRYMDPDTWWATAPRYEGSWWPARQAWLARNNASSSPRPIRLVGAHREQCGLFVLTNSKLKASIFTAGVTPLEVQEATSTTAMARITAVAITRSLSILPIAVMIRTSVRERKT
jgi:hypothetical protein